jgi:hypothetical protein
MRTVWALDARSRRVIFRVMLVRRVAPPRMVVRRDRRRLRRGADAAVIRRRRRRGAATDAVRPRRLRVRRVLPIAPALPARLRAAQYRFIAALRFRLPLAIEDLPACFALV